MSDLSRQKKEAMNLKTGKLKLLVCRSGEKRTKKGREHFLTHFVRTALL